MRRLRPTGEVRRRARGTIPRVEFIRFIVARRGE